MLKKIQLAVISLSCAVLFSSCSGGMITLGRELYKNTGESYKSRAAKTLWDNQAAFGRIAEYVLSQYDTESGKPLYISGEDFLSGDRMLRKDSTLIGFDDLAFIPIDDEQIIDDMRYLFEKLGYESIYVWESNWKNDIAVAFRKIPSSGKWETYYYHTAVFPPEGDDGHSLDAWYDKTENGLEYVGGTLYLGDSWYYDYGDLEGYGKYAG